MEDNEKLRRELWCGVYSRNSLRENPGELADLAVAEFDNRFSVAVQTFSDEERRSSSSWCDRLGIPQSSIIDPDGWDRTNFNASWSELITKKEFLHRCRMSTMASSLFPR